MSDGLARAGGGAGTIELDGKKYILEPIGIKDFATIEQYFLSTKPDPLAAIVERKNVLPKEDYDRLLDKAYVDATKANKATQKEIQEWIDSPEGICYTLWISLQKRYPDMTHELIEQLVDKMGEDTLKELMNERDKASGLDQRGNSTGRTSDPSEANGLQNGSSGEAMSKSEESQAAPERELSSATGEPSTES